MLSPGSTFGHYRIEACLGEGGMGVVYKALDTRLERVVALKLISEKLAGSEDYRQRLADEAKKAAKADSPHVVKVWEHSEHEGLPYISLEYVAGQDLCSRASDCDLEQKIDIARQIAEGIKAAHAVELIHRDLKPDNIRITDDNQVKIFDFGLAKRVRPDTVDQQGNIEGTLYYLSPEQLNGEPLTFKSDLFSLGTVLFELFTGERPFEGDYAASVMYSILHDVPPGPREIKADLPVWIEAMILKLLAKDPAERFDNIGAVLEHIDSCLADGDGGDRLEPIRRRQTVTVVNIKNLSGDDSWDYFCLFFTEDVMNEISRRTALVVSCEPSTAAPRNIREIFECYGSDFVIVGSLMKWQEDIKLKLSIYGDEGDKFVFGQTYDGPTKDLFKLLSEAAKDASIALADITGFSSIEVEGYIKTDVSAYEYYLKGKDYYHKGNEEDSEFAIRMFRQALEIDPDYALACSGLAEVYAFQYMCYYDRTPERINTAKEQALKAIEIDSRLPEAHRSLGRCYMEMNNGVMAERCFLKAIEINPKYAMGYRSLGWLKEKEGDHEQAIRWAKKSLELAPTDPETLVLLSLVNIDLRKYTPAIATLQRAIQLAPDYGKAYYNLGTVYLKLGVLDLALENFLMAVKYKGDPNCYLEAGFIHLTNGQYDEARTLFEESAKAGYLAFVAQYFLGYLEKARGRVDESVSFFQQAIEAGKMYREPDNPYVKAFRALALAGIGDYGGCRHVLDALAATPDLNGELLYNLARGYALLGDYEKAKSYIEQSCTHHDGPTEKEVSIDPHFAAIMD